MKGSIPGTSSNRLELVGSPNPRLSSCGRSVLVCLGAARTVFQPRWEDSWPKNSNFQLQSMVFIFVYYFGIATHDPVNIVFGKQHAWRDGGRWLIWTSTRERSVPRSTMTALCPVVSWMQQESLRVVVGAFGKWLIGSSFCAESLQRCCPPTQSSSSS